MTKGLRWNGKGHRHDENVLLDARFNNHTAIDRRNDKSVSNYRPFADKLAKGLPVYRRASVCVRVRSCASVCTRGRERDAPGGRRDGRVREGQGKERSVRWIVTRVET